MNLQSLTQFFAHIATDWFILGIFAVLVLIDALRSGTRRATALSIALPLTVLFYADIPQTSLFDVIDKQFSSPIAQATVVGAIFLVLFIVLYRISGSFSSDYTGGLPLQSILAALASTAIVAVVCAELSPIQALWHFGPQAQYVFGATFRLWWLTGAYIALATVRS